MLSLNTFSGEIKHDIDHRKSVTKNINGMDLIFNINKKFPTPNCKQNKTAMNKLVNGFVEEDVQKPEFPKMHVVERLENSANELRESNFKISKNQWILIAKDHKNYVQRQFKQKIRKFSQFLDSENDSE